MKYRLLSILIIVTFFLSCRNKNSLEYIVGQRIGKEMAFPENYTVINDTMNKALTDYESPIKIIYLFNGDCGFCKGSLKKWEDYIVNSAFKEYTDFIFMVYTSNEEFLKDDFQEKILNEYRFIILTCLFDFLLLPHTLKGEKKTIQIINLQQLYCQ